MNCQYNPILFVHDVSKTFHLSSFFLLAQTLTMAMRA